LFLLLLFVRSPWGQDIIVQQALSYIEGKTGTQVSVDQLYFTFDGDIKVEGLYLDDEMGDTLIYSRSLEVDIPFLPIIRGEGIAINKLDWDGLTARISRKDTVDGFNFEFLQEAFATTPDTTSASKPLELSINNVSLTNFDVIFNDDVDGMYAKTDFKMLHLTMEKLDLQAIVYEIDKVELQDASIEFIMNPAISKETDSTDDNEINSKQRDVFDGRSLPLITARVIEIKKTNFNFTAPQDGIEFKSKFKELTTQLETVDLQNQIYNASQFQLVQGDISLKMNDVKKSGNSVTSTSKVGASVFKWPGMKVALDNVSIQQTDVEYSVNGAVTQHQVFNPDSIAISDLNLESSRFYYRGEEMQILLEELSGSEASGIVLNHLAFNGVFSDQELVLNSLVASVNKNRLTGNLKMSYPSMKTLIDSPENLSINVNLPSFKLDLNDVFRFQPDLKSNTYLNTLATNMVSGNMVFMGTQEYLNIPTINLRWGARTKIYGTGNLQNLNDPENLSYNFGNASFITSRSDFKRFINEKDLGILLPQSAELAGQFKGNTTSLTTDSKLTTTLGNVNLAGDFKFSDDISFDATISLASIEIGKILQNPSLGELSMDLKAQGHGNSLNTLDASFQSTISSFSYKGYGLSNLPINGSLKDGKGDFASKYKDDNLNVMLATQIQLDSVATAATVDLNVVGVDLKAFNISAQQVNAAGGINITFKGNFTNYEVSTVVNDGIAVYNSQSYLLGKLSARAYVHSDTTAVDVTHKILDLKLRSNVDPVQLLTSLRRHVNRYLSDDVSKDTIQPVTMTVKASLSPQPILREIILPSLESIDNIAIAVDFNEKQRRLNTDIVIPYLKYEGSEVDSLIVTSRSDAESFSFDLGFKTLSSGPVLLKQTNLNGRIADDLLILDFESFDDKEKLMHFGGTLLRKRDELGVENLIFNLSVDDLVLNRESWSIPEDNEIAYGESFIKFNNFKLSNNNQSIELRSDIPKFQKDHVALLLDNFKLQSILAYVNPDDKLASGTLNGEFILEDIMGKISFIADVSIADFKALGTPLGMLKLEAYSTQDDMYKMNMGLKGTDVNLDLAGTYATTINDAQLDLNLDIARLSMTTISGLSDGLLKNGSGFLTGEISLSGMTLNPVYKGTLGFNNAGINVSMLNNKFIMNNEQIKLNNDAISMDDFKIRDQDGNIFSIDGTVGTKNLLTPTFDLKIKANNFTALNSTAQDNELYYGKVTFDASAIITGDLDIPIVDMKVSIDDATNFTYVIPATQLDVVQRNGIVQFVNKVNPEAILTQTEEESATLTSFDMSTAIKINNGATVNIIVDPSTGDNLQVSGAGDLQYKMTPNGRMTLTGRYEIDSGFYELSLYEIFSRRFELAKGGSVSWSGDPFNAALDVSAIYKVETSASALMASQTSGADIATKNKFRQKLPFLVYLNVDGELTSPEISFKLDLPEDEQGAIGGQVYGRIQQLNNQDQELIKQVFSLLAFNRFFPTSGTDGSNGGTATIARDNLNQALSDQLNQYGGKLLGNTGVDLNFGLDSYTDYQGASPQDRTQLDVTASKKLLDDRLIVSVGSEVDIEGTNPDGEQTPILGNVALEYLLDPNGRWRLKGFRKNQYDNVVDGQLIVSGIALIFSREFNSFSNLFKKTVQEEAQKARK
jgi:hypothetical protein